MIWQRDYKPMHKGFNMNNNLIRIALAGCAAVGLSVPATAFAFGSYTPYTSTPSNDCSGGGTSNPDCYTWTFDSQQDVYSGVKGTPVGTPAVTATPTGWANSVGSANVLLETAYIGSYSGGMGVTDADETGTAPNHAVDNSGRVDSILFTFSESVNLTSFNAGYVYTDSDFTVMAYVGDDGAANNTNIAGMQYGQLLDHGWMLIGNYLAGSSTGAHNFANLNNGSTSANNVFSSYWLIGALNTFVGGDPAKAGNDYFKILSLAGCDCSTAPPGTPGCGGHHDGVPEPGTLLLMGAGLLGLTRYNRRRLVRAA